MPRRSMHPRPMVVRSAPACICGKVIEPSYLRKLFCSNACNQRALNARRKALCPPVVLARRCACGADISDRRPDALSCSARCAERRRARKGRPWKRLGVAPAALACATCKHWVSWGRSGGVCFREVRVECQPESIAKHHQSKEAANG